MSKMIERVALAISGSDDPANILAIHRHRARAAIEAMREPPKGFDKIVYHGDYADDAWRDAIDEMLK